jgi:hypothetical protein
MAHEPQSAVDHEEVLNAGTSSGQQRCSVPAKEFTDPLKHLFLPLAHLDGMHRMVGSNLLTGLAAADRFHSDLCLEL